MSVDRRVLVADAVPGVQATLEAILRRAGWSVVSVETSCDVLRSLRDRRVDVVLIDPELPGTGVSGVDVVRTLKGASRFRSLPVLWLLRENRAAPADVPADGTLAVDRLDDTALVAAVVAVLAAPSPSAASVPAVADPLSADDVRRATESAVARYCERELRESIPGIVREIAREVVPEVAERLIREEIARLRAAHGFRAPG